MPKEHLSAPKIALAAFGLALLALAVAVLALNTAYRGEPSVSDEVKTSPPPAEPEPISAAQPAPVLIGTCTAEARGILSFACPGTPTEDVCGQQPNLYCFAGRDESCPAGTIWDPACSCACIPAP